MTPQGVVVEFAPVPVRPRIAQRLRSALHLASLVGLCALLVFAPLAFGAVEEWSVLVLETGSALIFALWAVSAFLSDSGIKVKTAYIPLGLFALWATIQILTGHTAYRNDTVSELWKFIAFALLFAVASQLLADERRLKIFACVTGAAGVLLALFALAQDFAGNGKLYWAVAPRFGGQIYGPYVNHNHYAGLMEMLWPILLLPCIAATVHGGKRVLLGFGAIITATSIFLSQSRGGMVAVAAQASFLIACFAYRPRYGRRQGLIVGIAVALLIGALFLVGGTPVFQRMSDPQDPYRLSIYKDALQMWKVHPVAGFGLGTFGTVYPQYGSFYTDLAVQYAHNDYLQLLVETGIIGAVLALWFLILVFRKGLQDRHVPYGSVGRALKMAAMTGCVGILAHSFWDFNLHIPANAALFFVLCGIATARMPSLPVPKEDTE